MAKKQGKQVKRGKGPYVPPPVTRVKFPTKRIGEMFGRIVDIYGNERMGVFCEDGKHRVGRIRGKIKKRVWIRKGDLVIVSPWDWETEVADKPGKCEITWRYTNAEISWLERNRRIPEILDINNIPL
ncbi:MAG TPA: translation initiation factor eIF-1A [Candidatus Nanopelagicaceae bacterium]|nr:translation initiation factor eIF-1A [Candidatus Lokiarchaeota archaeon]HUW90885.1 translation initiation factor eIF-1A [Candidatus Nanopelagicaceae bacterium]